MCYRFCGRLAIMVMVSLLPLRAHALAISLQDWVFNVDGNVASLENGDLMPTSGALINNLGTLSLEVSGAGAHSIISFFDFEIDEIENTFFANEFGRAVGSAAPGQRWEIDEPGYYFGDILDNAFGADVFGNPTNGLDNSNGVPEGLEDDVSFALGWDFTLLEGDIATIDFMITDVLPSVDFYLEHHDNDSNFSLYFYSTLNIVAGAGLPGGPTSVGESGSMMLLLMSLLLIALRNPQYIKK